MRKIKYCGLLVVWGCLSLLFSCLDSNEATYNDWDLGNAQIASFSLSHDSIAGLSTVAFTIDQLNSKIYNRDSMPYGTLVDRKVICSLTCEGVVPSILLVQQSTGDSIWLTGSDSVDFSAPVQITVYAYNGLSTKTYEAKLNVHQVHPDSMVWQAYTDLLPGKSYKEMQVIAHDNMYYMYAGDALMTQTADDIYRPYDLYRTNTSDGAWTWLPLSGFPYRAVLSQITEYENDIYVLSEDGALYRSEDGQTWSQMKGDIIMKALLGVIPANETNASPSILCGIATIDDVLHFVLKSASDEWKIGSKASLEFPMSGFGRLNYKSMYYPRLVVVGGRDAAGALSNQSWSTMDGLTWAPMTNSQFAFTPREGVAASFYDGCFYVIGGIDDSTALKDIYRSKDYGITWIADTTTQLCVMPDDYIPRGFSSVVIDKDNYMLLFGGKVSQDTYVLNEMWRGRINRLGFEKK